MTDTFNYAFVKNEEGNFSVRSTVKSFNLDHVTDKDIISFYHSFSSYASFDTGLLPLNGTGVLAIRTAGPHTQVVTQHAPGMYYVNWGAHERDSSAKAYYVAQPYRIVIGDFENGNLLGARMFYSPFPITSPSNILYHVNLPNINCKGYRGNGVGWICLYHTDDWSSLPFNEKVARFVERCSGVETYNDANMSETDGPRFYAAHGKPEYITNPASWQQKSEEGFVWTLDDDLWIPVLVKDMDHQDRHYEDGEPLTLAMAMLGNYQAYYTDKNIPKMYNVISRSDLSLSNSNIADFIKRSFASAPVVYQHQTKDDPYAFTVNHRQQNGSPVLNPNILISNDESDHITCSDCEEFYHSDDINYTAYDSPVCENCLHENYIFIESADKWYYTSDDDLVYSEIDDCYYHGDYDQITLCHSCDNYFGTPGNIHNTQEKHLSKIYWDQSKNHICIDCFNDIVNPPVPFEDDPSIVTSQCVGCSKKVITNTGWSSVYPEFKALTYDSDSMSMVPSSLYACPSCAPKYYVCPCGLVKDNSEINGPCTPTTFDLDDKTLTVNSCCQSCLGNATEQDGFIVMKYVPFSEDSFNKVLNSPIINHVAGVSITIKDTDVF